MMQVICSSPLRTVSDMFSVIDPIAGNFLLLCIHSLLLVMSQINFVVHTVLKSIPKKAM